MGGQAVVVAGGRLFDLGELIPGDGGEVVVFVVIADVEGYDVEDAIVAEGLLLLIVCEVVFLYPTGAQRVEADGEEEAQEKGDDGFGAEGDPDTGDEGGFRGPVEGDPFVEGFDLAQAGDAEDLEKRIEQQPDHLAD